MPSYTPELFQLHSHNKYFFVFSSTGFDRPAKDLAMHESTIFCISIFGAICCRKQSDAKTFKTNIFVG
jgi:hypothetical protein